MIYGMKALDRILTIAAYDIPRTGLDCLLIGGFTVNHYGFRIPDNT